MRELKQRTERTQAQIDALQEEQGSNVESEAELRRLRLLKKNYQTEFENPKKELAVLEKQAKNKGKEQAKVDRLRASLATRESERNAIEKRLNSTKPLEDLKERESEIQSQNREDQAIIQDDNTLRTHRDQSGRNK